jgi:GNAT superfamily N-acetyltransferase/DNA-binding transcriptional MerR regulator
MGATDAMTISELLKLAKESGIDINQRTVRLYADMGLIPRPDVRNRDEGGRSGYYDPRIVGILAAIPDLQQQGYSLKDIKSFLGRLESIAKQSGKDSLSAQVSGLEAIVGKTSEAAQAGRAGSTGTTGVTSAPAVWRSLSGPVVSEMLRRGMSPDTQRIDELTVMVSTRDGERFSVPVFLDLASVVYTSPAREDDAELGVIASVHLFELTGKESDRSAESIRNWLEKTYDMSRANFVIARRRGSMQAIRGDSAVTEDLNEAGRSIIGFVALGVEPERIRAGQVRLEGPYVVPQYRGQGLGRELLSRVESRALDLDARYIDAFVDSESIQVISFLRHSGFVPDHFYWEAQAIIPDVLPTGEDPLADKSRMRARLEIRPIASPDDLERALALEDQVMKDTPGYYRAKVEDLIASGTTFPMYDHFTAYLDGEFVGTVWNSTPSPRVYAVVLPRYLNTWIELALWRHILRHLRSKGRKTARTEAVSEVASGRKALSTLGFVVDKMVVCYRKRLDGR